MHKTFPLINEDLCKKIKFISSTDADKICENRQKSTQKLSTLLFLMSEGKYSIEDIKELPLKEIITMVELVTNNRAK
jgi:hypothetical protein